MAIPGSGHRKKRSLTHRCRLLKLHAKVERINVAVYLRELLSFLQVLTNLSNIYALRFPAEFLAFISFREGARISLRIKTRGPSSRLQGMPETGLRVRAQDALMGGRTVQYVVMTGRGNAHTNGIRVSARSM